MARIEEVNEKINAVKDSIKSKCIVYNYHEQKTSVMESVFARGDRRLCDVLIKAFEKGAKIRWMESEYFKFDVWQDALKECGLDEDFYALQRKNL